MKGENNTNITFSKGIFTEIVIAFLNYKRSLGYKYDDGRMYTMRKILVVLNSFPIDYPVLTKDMVVKVIERSKHESQSSQTIRITLIRQFSLFLIQLGYEAYVLPKQYIKYQKTIFKSFIYTEKEINNIILNCDNYCINSKSLSKSSQIVYPFLVRILYSCGLRISEALRLKTTDVFLKEGYIQINESKNMKTRQIPLSSTMIKCLMKYEKLKEENLIKSKDKSYFPAPDGLRFSRSGASCMIKHFIAISVTRKDDDGNTPRIHDIRHTAAVRILENLQKAGKDLNTNLPLLSIFLGHDSISETEQYLQFPSYSFHKIDEIELFDDMIPKVGDIND